MTMASLCSLYRVRCEPGWPW